jgi:hypothetical protein
MKLSLSNRLPDPIETPPRLAFGIVTANSTPAVASGESVFAGETAEHGSQSNRDSAWDQKFFSIQALASQMFALNAKRRPSGEVQRSLND